MTHEFPITRGRLRGAPALIGDYDAFQTQRPKVHSFWVPYVQTP